MKTLLGTVGVVALIGIGFLAWKVLDILIMDFFFHGNSKSNIIRSKILKLIMRG